MEKLGGTIAAIAIAVSLAGVSSIQPAAAQTVAAAMPTQSPKITLTRAFDGLWSVAIATVNGACPASLRYPALIANGLVGMANGEFGYQISGAVYNTGGIVVTVSQNGQSATGRGRLSRLRGGGTWMTADRQCSGTWVADRRS
jgi:hypothetical protein